MRFTAHARTRTGAHCHAPARPPLGSARGGRLAVAALVAAGGLLAGGCVPGTDGSGAASVGAPGAVSSAVPDPAKAGKVTLTVWDQEVRGGQNNEVRRLNAQFERKYPNVRIKRVARSFSDLKTTLKLAISGNRPPDVIQANQGYPDMVAFVKAGLLAPLDTYAGIYDSNTRYPRTLLNLNRVSADASHFGTGRLYGISQTGEYIGVYYDKDVLAKAGISPPRTWKDFTAALPKLRKAGQLPVQFGDLDKYPAIHTFGVLQDEAAGADGSAAIRDTVLGRGKGFDNAPTRAAARTLADWKKRGYIPKGANGTGYDDAAQQFAGGEGAFLITGTWELADLKKPMGSKLGFMPPPPARRGAAPMTTGGEGLAWSLTARSRHPEVAAAYLDFITDDHAADVMTKAGVLPAVPGRAARKLPRGSVEGRMTDGWQKLNEDDGLVPYLDYTTPGFYDSLSSRLQGVINGSLPPQRLASSMQHDYSAFRAEQRASERKNKR
jgi:raffinose/stachyose/melibiose transport system substrate-binding protein